MSDNSEHQFIENVLRRCFNDYSNYTLHSPDSVGSGYAATMLFVKVNCKNKVLHLVIKRSLQDEDKRKFIDPKPMYEREAYFYSVFYPAITEYQIEMTGYQMFSSIAQCYGSYFEDKSEAIALEDLTRDGYKVCDRKVPMDEYHISLALKELGKFHGISLAMKHQDPQKFYELTSPLRECSFFVDTVRQTLGVEIFDQRLQLIAESLKNDGRREDADKIDLVRKDIPDILFRYTDPKDSHSVVLHGDCWLNNIMFKYEDASSKPLSVRFLDFQVSRLGSPLLDISYLVYNCASKHVLYDINKYLQIYHNSLSTCLEELGCDVAEVFSFSLMQEHWRKYSKFGLVWSTTVFRMILCDEDEAPNMTGDEFHTNFLKPIRNQHCLNERIMNVVAHFLDNKII